MELRHHAALLRSFARFAVQTLACVLAGQAWAAAPASRPVAGMPAAGDNAGLRCSGQAAQPGSLSLQLGKSTLVRMPEAVQARSVGNPAVLQAMLVAPDTLYVVGVDIGSSNMIVQGRSGLCNVVEVVVGIDPGALQQALATLMPEQKNIQVSAAGDTLVISGTVDDAPTAARVLELAAAFVRRPAQALDGARHAESSASSTALQTASMAASAWASAPGSVSGSGSGAGSGSGLGASAGSAAQASSRIINFLNIGAPQQVMLEVKIAEVSKSLLDKLEASVTLNFGGGSWASTLSSNFVSGTLKSLLSVGNRGVIAADKQDALVRVLAEPTVMAISGQEGSFLAGGRIFVPVAQDNNKITLEEKEFGVGLRFTPTVLAGGRINLRVAPEVSEISREGIGISAAGYSGTSLLPLFTTRRASTTVELFDGQSFAIGGLIKNSQTSSIHGLPILGELPVLGALFRSTDFQQDRTELLFIVTPHLVQPLPANYKLPTDSVTTPGRARLFLGGRLEGPPEQDAERK